MKHFLLILFFCIKSSFLIAQVGGESVYTFLKLNMSSNYSALGGFVPSVDIQGANAMTSNPALVDSLDYLTASINYWVGSLLWKNWRKDNAFRLRRIF